MILGSWFRFAGTLAFAALTTACVIESSSHSNHHRRPGPASSGSSSPPPAQSGSSSPVAPILVTVDTDRTMDADPGEGVGIFTEYKSGGHWHVWWTCDTNQTREPCPMDVRIRHDGALSNVEGDELLEGDTLSVSVDGREVQVRSTTTDNVAGVYFDTEPGAIVELAGSVGSITGPGFFFFVQDGKVNGGFDGQFTNPLRFQGSKP